MTDHEQEKMELELRRIRPARLPDDFAARLQAAKPPSNFERKPQASAIPSLDYLRMLRQSLRWLVPASAAIVVLVVSLKLILPSVRHSSNPRSGIVAVQPALKADDVKIDQRLISSFDAVARLPGGEPVRFRCENWMDQLVLKDSSKGLIVENRQPRLEVVPVGFETY